MSTRVLAVVALVASGSAVPVAAWAESRSTGVLELHLRDDLVLGRDLSTDVHLLARDAQVVHLVTSAGTITSPLREGQDLRAVWTLPTERRPQLAIIAAVAEDGSVRDWIAVPLAGQARINVETEARASVVVQVAGLAFGPVIADGHGVAQVPIVVPPGIEHVTTIATSVSGNATEKRVALGARSQPRVLALCSINADRIVAIATTPAGAPGATAPLVTTSAGNVSAMTTTAPGIFEARLAIDASVEALTARVVLGEEASTCDVHVKPELPTAVTIALDRPFFVAGSGKVVDVRVNLVYPGHRRALEIEDVTLSTDLGTISKPTHVSAGFVAQWTLPDDFKARSQASVVVRVAAALGALTAPLASETSLALLPAAASRIEASTPAPVRGDGETHGEILARVVDRFGNPTVAPGLTAHGRGQIGRFAKRAGGIVAASYVAPRTYDRSVDVVELDGAGPGISGHLVVPITPIHHRLALGARLGYLSNVGRISTPIAVGSVAARLPVLAERLVAGAELAIYSTTIDVPGPGETISTALRAMPFLAKLGYRMPLGRVDLSGGAGIGAVLVTTRVSSPSAGTTGTIGLQPAAALHAGATTHTGPGWLTLEIEYLHATIDGDVQGRIGGIIVTAGYGVEL